MENNDKNKEKITHKHVASGPPWRDQQNLSVLDNWQIYSDSATDMKYNSSSISSFLACRRIFGKMLAMESQKDSENKLNNLEVTYEYVMQLRGGVKKPDILQSGWP